MVSQPRRVGGGLVGPAGMQPRKKRFVEGRVPVIGGVAGFVGDGRL